MTRTYLALAGLAALLSGCLVVVSPPVSNFRFDSNWQRVSDGAYVFCTNRDTFMRYRFRAPDSSLIQSITETYQGFASGNTYVENRSPSRLTRDGSDLVFVDKLAFGQGAIPQGLDEGVSAQSITVTPVNPPTSRNGATTVTVTVTTISGRQYSGSYTYDTYANCP
ncbi:hypothetical protein DV704_05525 [Meiothermus sp. QL-1]|uniref:hypothetical protein n=1 Tax=Meiothermus sp. QL-1 TaxID=2058095 RepID=UPI000E0B557A|nr:hypothetical protein [Meiothermus sp. QL-1]RDI95733.1 hypothetical protein DV704_05525 [Meiothermus sp. QL-1]